jgi:hypothetical protein
LNTLTVQFSRLVIGGTPLVNPPFGPGCCSACVEKKVESSLSVSLIR